MYHNNSPEKQRNKQKTPQILTITNKVAMNIRVIFTHFLVFHFN